MEFGNHVEKVLHYFYLGGDKIVFELQKALARMEPSIFWHIANQG